MLNGVREQFSGGGRGTSGVRGEKAIFLQGAFYEGAAIASQAGLTTDFLTDLGFVIPTEVNAYIREGEQA